MSTQSEAPGVGVHVGVEGMHIECCGQGLSRDGGGAHRGRRLLRVCMWVIEGVAVSTVGEGDQRRVRSHQYR
jgi:hypothetical protein